jgi:hypothetical protein
LIAIKIQAGIGNQLFQYAFSYALAKKHDTILTIDGTYPQYYPTSHEIPKQAFHLNRFSIFPSPEFDNPLLKYGISFLPKRAIKKIYIKNQKSKIRKLGLTVVTEDITQGQKNFSNVPNNSYLEGYFQYPALFQSHKKEITSKFQFPKPIFNNDADKLISRARTPVAVNLRRKDYLLPYNLKNQGICSINYYQTAIKYIEDRVPDPTFFVISDDISDAKKYLSSIKANLYFINDDENKDILSDMYLMQQCQHLIIANSSYSWWAAYLTKDDKKIAIAPKNWVSNQDWSAFNDTIIPSNWIRI